MLEALAALDEAIGPAGLALLREELGAEADAAAWLRALEERAQPLVAALRSAASAAQGPDWPEQNWDSYYFSSFEREEWAVTVPFAVLPAAASAVVPVAAAERILGVPESLPDPSEPWARPQPGRFYRRYWPADRRFLTLVADIAARFLEDGGEALAADLRSRLRRLPATDRAPLELHLATNGLLESDPLPLLREVLRQADGEDLGQRGELVLHALSRLEQVPREERRALLADAARVARQTTAYVASNPFAAAVEALAQAEVGSVGELCELVDRAARLKFADWEGWDRALAATCRALTALVRYQGEEVVATAVRLLQRYDAIFPAMSVRLTLAGARGLPAPQNLTMARRSLQAAQALPCSPEAAEAEVAAAGLLAELGDAAGLTELAAVGARLAVRPARRANQAGLARLAITLAQLDRGDGELLAQALTAAVKLRDPEQRWLVYTALGTAPATAPEVATQCFEQAARASRRWLLRRPPLEALVPWVMGLARELPGGPRHPLLARLVSLARAAAEGDRSGADFARALVDLAPLASATPELQALARLERGLGDTWWRLPLLVLIADGAALHLRRLAGREAVGGEAACRPPAHPPAERG